MPFRLTILHLSQDDPKKNTAKKLERFGFAELVERVHRLPRGGILLDPFAPQALSFADRLTAEKHGIVALDCSWRQAEQMFPEVRKRLVPRALPFLVAGNRINYGRPFMLSTAEAVSAACIILREKTQGEAMMAKFAWGHSFLEVNAEPLEEYAARDTSAEVVAAQRLFLPDVVEEPEEGAPP